jgi:hypothetical protein
MGLGTSDPHESKETIEREFDLTQALALVTGKVVQRGQSFAYQGDIDNLAHFLTGQRILMARRNEEGRDQTMLDAGAEIVRQHPELANLDTSGLNPEGAEQWLQGLIEEHGNKITLKGREE